MKDGAQTMPVLLRAQSPVATWKLPAQVAEARCHLPWLLPPAAGTLSPCSLGKLPLPSGNGLPYVQSGLEGGPWHGGDWHLWLIHAAAEICSSSRMGQCGGCRKCRREDRGPSKTTSENNRMQRGAGNAAPIPCPRGWNIWLLQGPVSGARLI